MGVYLVSATLLCKSAKPAVLARFGAINSPITAALLGHGVFYGVPTPGDLYSKVHGWMKEILAGEMAKELSGGDEKKIDEVSVFSSWSPPSTGSVKPHEGAPSKVMVKLKAEANPKNWTLNGGNPADDNDAIHAFLTWYYI